MNKSYYNSRESVKEYIELAKGKVLHHLNDEELALSVKWQYEILNPNGIICHSLWKGEGTIKVPPNKYNFSINE